MSWAVAADLSSSGHLRRVAVEQTCMVSRPVHSSAAVAVTLDRTILSTLLQVARLLLYKEFWYGTADSTGSSSSSRRLQLLPAHRFEVPVTELQRPQPADLAGTWNVFVLAAHPAVEENPNTLQVRVAHEPES